MDDIRRLLNPYSLSIRRAVFCPTTGCVIDKTQAPEQPEVNVLSELCALVFDVEPRHQGDLLERAIILNVQAAWTALYDDIQLGLSFDASGYGPMLLHHLLNSTSCQQLYVLGALMSTVEVKDLDIQRMAASIQQYRDDVLYIPTIEKFQKIVQQMCPDTETVARLLLAHPELSGVFVTHPMLVDVYIKHRDLPGKLCDYAMSQDVSRRYFPLSIVAIWVHNGLHIQHPVGIDTLTQMHRKKFDIRICAAASVVAQSSEEPTVRKMCMLLETLCATVQRHLGPGVVD